MIQPTKILKSASGDLELIWPGKPNGIIPIKLLRDQCPCATCSGESVILQTAKPQKIFLETPGRYDVRTIQPVGNYAITISWGDGHNTGIYSWDLLEKLSRLSAALEAQEKQKHHHSHDHDHHGHSGHQHDH